jgi:sRNA-binding regulator protein Hfq
MGLLGLTEYLKEKQPPSVFDELAGSGSSAVLHSCDSRDYVGSVVANGVYDFTFRPVSGGAEPHDRTMAKVEMLLVCGLKDRPEVLRQVKGEAIAAEPLKKPGERHHIKNKTLFPLMEERQVVFITLLDGRELRGLIAGFNRYEIRMNLKGGVPVTVLRHGVLACRNKVGRSLLKRDQELFRDWEKSPLYSVG